MKLKPFTDCPGSNVILPPDLSKKRRDYFMQKKLLAFKRATGVNNCYDGFKASLPDFLAMLKAFAVTDSSDNYVYNAMRVYFGAYPKPGGSPTGHIPPGKDGYPTVVFVPTTGDDNNSPVDGEDDWSNFYFVDENGNIKPGNKGTFGKIWKANFQRDWSKILNDDGNAELGGKGFKETFALLYAMNSIGGTDNEQGMIEVIECGLNDSNNPITGLNIQFSCFIKTEPDKRFNYPYKLSLIFNLPQAKDKAGVSLGSLSYKNGVIDTDTGIPCPPNGNCL